MRKKLGEEEVHKFRRSWDNPPKPLNINSPYHPKNISIYNDIPRNLIPDTESLKDTYNRVVNYFTQKIYIEIKNEKNILISAHGNSVRALCKFLFKLDEKQIPKLEIPTGNPLHIELDQKLKIIKCRYLDQDRAQDLLVF